MRPWQETPKGNEPVKCGCGLTMRRRNWANHWRICRVGSVVSVSEQDVRDLEASETRRSA